MAGILPSQNGPYVSALGLTRTSGGIPNKFSGRSDHLQVLPNSHALVYATIVQDDQRRK